MPKPKKQGTRRALDDATQQLLIDKLSSSGLDLDDFQALGMSALSGEEFRATERSFPNRPALALNYHDLAGEPWRDAPGAPVFARYRVLGERHEFKDDLKKTRYLQVFGTLPGVYFPRGFTAWPDVAEDVGTALIITEGELKAAKACKEGFPTIGLGGVWNFRSRERGYDFLPQLEEIAWARRNVYVIFDSDLATNEGVLAALKELAYHLEHRGAYVYVCWLPAGEDDEKVGLDDFLVAHGPDELAQVLHHADPIGLTKPLFDLNERYVYVADPGLLLDTRTGAKHKPSALKEHLAAPTTVLVKKLTAEGEVRHERVSAGAEWLRWPLRNEVGRLTYAPGAPRYAPDGAAVAYNLWAGWAAEPQAGDVSPFLELVDHLFSGADPKAKEWFLRWCAYPLQYPGTKLFSASVIWGRRHGTGKSLVFETLGAIYGKNWTAITQQDLEASHNEWAQNKQFVLGDDVSGSERREVADVLKKLITQQRVRLNPKYVPSFELPDVINYGFTANHPDAFFMEDDDRRYFIHEVTAAAKPEEWYIDYKLWLDTGGAGAIFDWLLKLDLGDFNPAGRAYNTAAKQAMIADTRSDLAAWVRQLLEDPDSVLRLGAIVVRRELFTNAELLQFFDPEGKTRVSANGLGRELKRAGGVQVNQGAPVRGPQGVGRYYAVRNAERWRVASASEVTKQLALEAKLALQRVNGHAH